jgi:cbb3-type cytochrome oxidase maturation protein
MDIIYLLLPLSLVLVGIIVAAILWAVKTRQFDDLEGPAYRILMDDPEEPPVADSDREPRQGSE